MDKREGFTFDLIGGYRHGDVVSRLTRNGTSYVISNMFFTFFG